VRAQSIRIPSHDGDELDAHLGTPDAGRGPGMVLLHEALGVTDYTRDVAARLAGLGYVTAAPDLFWRIERNVDLPHHDSGLMRALELVGQFDPERGVRDVDAALGHLRAAPEVDGPVGVIGFCFGGGVAYRAACDLDPDCAVSYYGVGLETMLDRLPGLTCPALFHVGDDDAFIPADALAQLRDAFADKPNVDVEVYEGAGHAFDNPEAPWHAPDAAARAWGRTAGFLAAHLGGAAR
jgi:carboxymethylenebutenolidase